MYDGIETCYECGEYIEEDEVYYEIDGVCYCEDCMEDHKHHAHYDRPFHIKGGLKP